MAPIISIRYIIAFIAIMESLSDNFEKHVNEIHFLRKQISGEKLSHENTLKQLQNTYQIIDQMKDALRLEQSHSMKLKHELSETTNRLGSVSRQYQDQIRQIKQMISLKDEQLRRINSFLMVNDADIIRLKIINEVQLTHREEMERLNVEIGRKNVQINEISANYLLLKNKNDHLQKEMKQQEAQLRDQFEQASIKHLSQLKNTFQKLQKQRSEHNKWAKKYEILESRLQKQTEFYKAEIHKLNQELQAQNKASLSNSDGKINKHKIEKLEESISKVKEQLLEEKEANDKLEDEINRLKKECKNSRKGEQDLLIQKERLIQQIEQLRREASQKESENKMNINAIYKEFEGKSDHNSLAAKETQQNKRRQENEIKRLTHKLKELEVENETLKQQQKDKILAQLKREVGEKANKIAQLKEQIRCLKEQLGTVKVSDKRRATSVYEKKDENIPQYKEKLRQANEKIMSLLKEKIQFKKEIASLRGK